jgi:hypothetical protein
VKVGLEYKVRHVGADWIIDGDIVSSISRRETVTTPGVLGGPPSTRQTQSLPSEIQLIDD